jgi:molybdopterin-containing oxidoreductase family iron-sulfur binding subunit
VQKKQNPEKQNEKKQNIEANVKRLSRRQLMALGGVGALGALASGRLLLGMWELEAHTPPESAWVPPPNPDFRFGMVMDLGLCIGCRRCAYGCKLENNIPDAISPPYIMVFETEKLSAKDYELPHEKLRLGNRLQYTRLRKDRTYMPVQCNHCANPPCEKVCPTHATYMAPDGIVMIDYNKCIGCRYCMQACPYNARRFNWVKPEIPPDRVNPLVPIRTHGVVEKCTFCVHRTRKGETTRCVEVCPNKVRIFGNLNDPDSEVSKLIMSERSFRFKERLNTGPKIWYIRRSGRKPMKWYTPLPPPRNIRGMKS